MNWKVTPYDLLMVVICGCVGGWTGALGGAVATIIVIAMRDATRRQKERDAE